LRFKKELIPDRKRTLAALGYSEAVADEELWPSIEKALTDVSRAAIPRWVWKVYNLDRKNGIKFEGTNVDLKGEDIKKHLTSCLSCIILAVTLGQEVERLIKSTMVTGVLQGFLTDVVAGVLVGQYADEAERILREEYQTKELYLTGRYSPGYGDLDLSIQDDLLALIDSSLAIGLTVVDSHIMLPRKSISALIGVSDHPVTGHLAGCENCSIRNSCDIRKDGKFCGKICN